MSWKCSISAVCEVIDKLSISGYSVNIYPKYIFKHLKTIQFAVLQIRVCTLWRVYSQRKTIVWQPFTKVVKTVVFLSAQNVAVVQRDCGACKVMPDDTPSATTGIYR